MRLIDADALMLYLNDIYFRNSPNGNSWRETLEMKQYREGVCEGLEMAMKSVEEAPTVDGWINVKDRLPEEKAWVLCYCRAKISEVLRWENGQWYHDPSHAYFESFVTHWMPLPEPPKENTDDHP